MHDYLLSICCIMATVGYRKRDKTELKYFHFLALFFLMNTVKRIVLDVQFVVIHYNATDLCVSFRVIEQHSCFSL